MLRVVADGNVGGTRILDAETGEDVTSRLGVMGVKVVAQGPLPPAIELETRVGCRCDATGQPRWHAKNPQTGQVQELRAMEFADGTRVDLVDGLFPSLHGRDAGTA